MTAAVRPAFPSWRVVGAAAALTAVLFGAGVWYASGIPTAADADEARAVWEAVAGGGALPAGSDATWRPGRRRTRLCVHGVEDAAAQGRIVECVRAARERIGAKPVRIEFRTARTITSRPGGRGVTVESADEGDSLRVVTLE